MPPKSLNKGGRSLRGAVLLVLALILVLGGIWWYTLPKGDNGEIEFSFAYQDRVADAASIVAVEMGFFEEEGLNVRPMVFSSGPATAEALIYGDAEFSTMGDTTGLIVVSQSEAHRILCSHGGGEKRHRVIVSDSSGIESIQDLEGKRIGVKKGTSTHGGLLRLSDSQGLDLEDEMIDLDPSDQLSALSAGELDAIVASEPTPSQAEVGGYGRELVTLGDLGNTYPILLVVDDEFAQEHSETVVKVIRVMMRATGFIHEFPEEAAAIQSEMTGLSTDVLERAMSFHYYNVSMDESTLVSLEQTARFLEDIGTIEETPDLSFAVDTVYLEEAQTELGIVFREGNPSRRRDTR